MSSSPHHPDPADQPASLPISDVHPRLRMITRWGLVLSGVIIVVLLGLTWMNTPAHVAPQDPYAANVAGQAPEVKGRIDKVVVVRDNVHSDDPSMSPNSRELMIDATLDDGRVITTTLVDETGLYHAGTRALFTQVPGPDQTTMWLITDLVRAPGLFILVAVFVLVVVALSRWQGVLSLVSLALSGFILVGIAIPAIGAGFDPVLIAILASMAVLWITLPLTHGLSWTTAAAMVGTLISLAATALITMIAVWGTSLTGLAQENIRALPFMFTQPIDIAGLLVAGMIIGVLGIVDDVTVSQSATVAELKKANPNLAPREYFYGALRVGRDHISASVNTLFLAYAGAALPLLLFVSTGELTWSSILTSESIAQELVRTLAGSMGLVLAVPVTTWMAVWLVSASDADGHAH